MRTYPDIGLHAVTSLLQDVNRHRILSVLSALLREKLLPLGELFYITQKLYV